jgi:DNA-binding SARP family transcriptional activator
MATIRPATREDATFPSHRADAPGPPNVPHAVVRSALLDRLEARWDHLATTVVAPAGFGKSVLLGQAMRANRARPRGVEAYVSCRVGAESSERLVLSVEAAFGAGEGTRGSPLDRLYAVVAEQAPLHVALVLDDLELLADEPAALLHDLLRRAPSNLHLVLCGRRVPTLGLARLRAADELVEIREGDLRFDEAEVAALTTSLGAAPLEADFAGWPALVRLALVAPRRTVNEFVWEEVIGSLDDDDRAALLALCLLGPSSVRDIEAVTGHPVDADAFCDRVPLVLRTGDDLVAHDLWSPYLDDLAGTAGDGVATVARRVVEAVAQRGDAIATGSVALRLGDLGALAAAAVDLVRTTIGSLPTAVAERWSAALRSSIASDPTAVAGFADAAELLDCAIANARSASSLSAERLDLLADAFHQHGDGDGEAVALALATLASEARGDLGHLLGLAARARTLAEDRREPLLQLLVASVDSAVAGLTGDFDTALALLAEPVGSIPLDRRPEAMVRLHWHFLILAGRAGDAAELTASLDPVPGMAVQRELHAVASFLDGRPAQLVGLGLDIGSGRYEQLTERDRFDQAAFVAVLAAAAPDPEPVRRALAVLNTSPFAAEAGPDGALAVAARACGAVVEDDDDAAEAIIAHFVEHAGGPDGALDPATDAHLRRALAVPYACSPVLRERWDAAALGPAQKRTRAVARLLVDARDGHLPADPGVPLDAIAAALPLRWSVELACRAARAGVSWGADLAVRLVDLFADDVLGHITPRLDDPDDEVQQGAGVVVAALPARPPSTVAIGLLGPLTVHHDGLPVDAPELHRTRVRELLCLLVVERTVSRDRAIDLLWPDVDPSKGRANLRVNLRHLQRVLEPGRAQGAAPYFLRGDAQQLQLADVPGLEVDLWSADADLIRADAARRQGDGAGRLEYLRAAVARWRGRPLVDLDRVGELDHVTRTVETRLVEAAATLGELELVGGATAAAAALAQQVLGADPYLERGHRLAVAAHLQARDRTATMAAAGRLRAVFDELGVSPEPATQILMRNVAQWLGPIDLTAAPTPTTPLVAE